MMYSHIRNSALSLRSLLRALRAVRHEHARVTAGPVGCARYHTSDTCIWQTDLALPGALYESQDTIGLV